MKVVLASGSPRRIELMAKLGLDYEVRNPNVQEVFFKDPVKTVETNALLKAKSVRRDKEVVLGFDTIVYIDGEILGKPGDKEDAFRILKRLSGRIHRVYTGIAILLPDKEIVDHEISEVKFKELSDEEIREYIESGEPMDKAGAYGYQNRGRKLVEYVRGSEKNVIGLPLEKLKKILQAVVEF